MKDRPRVIVRQQAAAHELIHFINPITNCIPRVLHPTPTRNCALAPVILDAACFGA